MNRIRYEGNTFGFSLDFADGTGFQWAVVYKSDNLELINKTGKVDREDPTSTGGRGNDDFEFVLTEGDEAFLMLRYARPWEREGDFQTYAIKAENGIINDIQEKAYGLYRDFSSEYEFRGDDYLSLFVLKSWEFEVDDNEEKVIYCLKPAGEEGWIRVSHTDMEIEGTEMSFGSTVFVLREGYIYRKDGILCETAEASWLSSYFAELLAMLDMVSYE